MCRRLLSAVRGTESIQSRRDACARPLLTGGNRFRRRPRRPRPRRRRMGGARCSQTRPGVAARSSARRRARRASSGRRLRKTRTSRRRRRGCEAIVHVAGSGQRAFPRGLPRGQRRAEPSVSCARPARSAPDALFVLVSSQAAAGPAQERPSRARGRPARPVSWYGLSKREGRKPSARLWPGPWIVLRPGVVYGPGTGASCRTSALAASRLAARSGGVVPRPVSRTRGRSPWPSRGRPRGRTWRAESGFSAIPEPLTARRAGRGRSRGACGSRPPAVRPGPDRAAGRGLGDARREAVTRPVPALQRGQGPGDPGGGLALRFAGQCDRTWSCPPPDPPAGGPRGRPGDWYFQQGWLRFVKFAKMPRTRAPRIGGRAR